MGFQKHPKLHCTHSELNGDISSDMFVKNKEFVWKMESDQFNQNHKKKKVKRYSNLSCCEFRQTISLSSCKCDALDWILIAICKGNKEEK